MSATAAVAGVPNGTAAPNPTSAAPGQQAPASGAPAAPAPWYGDLSADPDTKGYVELKAWKTPVDAIKAARDAEKLIGVPKDQLLRLPKPDAQQADRDAAMGAIYDSLGRPRTPAEYKLPVIENDAQSAEFAGKMAPILHGIGLSQDQAAKLGQAWNAYISESVKAQETAQAQQEQVDIQNLHKEWPGDVYTQREEMARRAVREFVNPLVKDPTEAQDMLGKIEEAIGTSSFLKLFSGIGEKVGEAKYRGEGSSSTFGMTPAAAQTRLNDLKGDKEWGARYLKNPKGPEGQEFDRLSAIAFQGKSA